MSAQSFPQGSRTPSPSSETSHAREYHTHTRQSSICSEVSGFSAGSSNAEQVVQSSIATTKQSPSNELTESLLPKSAAHPIDPLSRAYPKPEQEIDVREALDRKPGRWTLGHYINETSVRRLGEKREPDPEKNARDLETRKQELLRAREEIQRMSLPK